MHDFRGVYVGLAGAVVMRSVFLMVGVGRQYTVDSIEYQQESKHCSLYEIKRGC